MQEREIFVIDPEDMEIIRRWRELNGLPQTT